MVTAAFPNVGCLCNVKLAITITEHWVINSFLVVQQLRLLANAFFPTVLYLVRQTSYIFTAWRTKTIFAGTWNYVTHMIAGHTLDQLYYQLLTRHLCESVLGNTLLIVIYLVNGARRNSVKSKLTNWFLYLLW